MAGAMTTTAACPWRALSPPPRRGSHGPTENLARTSVRRRPAESPPARSCPGVGERVDTPPCACGGVRSMTSFSTIAITTAIGESRIASDECDHETDCGSDNEIAELHREPQRPIQPIGKMIHRPEHALLSRRDLGAARPGERPAHHNESHCCDRERAPVNRHPWIMPRILRSQVHQPSVALAPYVIGRAREETLALSSPRLRPPLDCGNDLAARQPSQPARAALRRDHASACDDV